MPPPGLLFFGSRSSAPVIFTSCLQRTAAPGTRHQARAPPGHAPTDSATLRSAHPRPPSRCPSDESPPGRAWGSPLGVPPGRAQRLQPRTVAVVARPVVRLCSSSTSRPSPSHRELHPHTSMRAVVLVAASTRNRQTPSIRGFLSCNIPSDVTESHASNPSRSFDPSPLRRPIPSQDPSPGHVIPSPCAGRRRRRLSKVVVCN
ncbi:hypothetical protein Purlil1_12277 [Purpureocillium lilacinum]|uniref:Uncharacterized protein n=1 Tax=Purpureocillium lilacinum TaxID=33203 RepID=A0ABR0BH75_PURLI|nr:hypothetical protein Purlil1_12277 [Purpureocillium lilacinum]